MHRLELLLELFASQLLASAADAAGAAGAAHAAAPAVAADGGGGGGNAGGGACCCLPLLMSGACRRRRRRRRFHRARGEVSSDRRGEPRAWSGTPIWDTSCCCHPLTYLCPGPRMLFGGRRVWAPASRSPVTTPNTPAGMPASWGPHRNRHCFSHTTAVETHKAGSRSHTKAVEIHSKGSVLTATAAVIQDKGSVLAAMAAVTLGKVSVSPGQAGRGTCRSSTRSPTA